MKRPSGPDAICKYFAGRGEAYWNCREGATRATYIAYLLIANYLDVPEEVDVISDQGEDKRLPWHEVQKAICDGLQTPDGLVTTVMDLMHEVDDDDLEERLSIGDNYAYAGRDDFSQDIDWEELLSNTKLCWQLVSMNT